ncbi:AMP-binding protein [Lysinibacillus xylanilyticus]|uniref:AMP-binding protein n=1 Tax=Lysinibacillus xylanilyticus TaxID=582475 RepID=A0A0K9FCQ3_9BACI|nr:non-ribosomal peptide synthetase [Lysinibacillus xylanilyticus]KMY31906.1 AMP-binding protein [Lysinibacillus xylanilyticus]
MEKLDKKNIENIMGLTSLQQSMLFSYVMDENSRECHEQLSLSISGDIKIDLLEQSWDYVIKNNEMLRTVFRWKGIDNPVQIVKKNHKIAIQYFDFTNELEKNKVVEEIKLMDLSTRIDIAKETLRVYLCKIDNNKYEMIITNHHIIYDGWSNGIILKELFEAYSCLYRGSSPKAKIKTKFSDFVNYTINLNKNEQKEYWDNYFNESDNAICCFEGKVKGEYKEILYKLDNEISNRISEFSKNNRISLASLLYTAWGVLMQKISNSQEVIFGTTVSGRSEKIRDIDNMVGLFINIIPMTVKSEDETLLIDLVRNIDKVLSGRKDFENTPIIDIKEYCGLKANEDLFNSVVTVENYPLNIGEDNILSIENFSMIERNNYNISLQILTFNGIEFKFDFNSLVIEEAIVKRFAEYLENIINSLLNNKDIKLLEVELLSEGEKHRILNEFNNTNMDYPKDLTIQKMFEEQVEKTPDNIAVVFEENKLTYRELNEKANRLARTLREKGTVPETVVALMVDRSVEMVVGVLGIIKSGAAYMPIDPNYPKERINYILKNSNADLLVTESKFVDSIDLNCQIVDINKEFVNANNESNLDIVNKQEDLLYVLYTSGTTGKPKGVMVTQGNLMNMAYSWISHYNLEEFNVNLLQMASISFDVFSGDLCRSLLTGGTMYICPSDIRTNMEELYKTIKENHINIFESTPSLISILMDYVNENKLQLDSLKLLILGSDDCSIEDYKKLVKKYGKTMRILNSYGVTEATIDSSYYEGEIDNIPKTLVNTPIGKPMHNTRFYILNKTYDIQPIGVVGELYIAGAGVSRGYYNRPELTAEKFIDNPFKIGTKMYKTGDLARWLPDGNIEFLGRIDNQVKIRGFRIELAEIENRLLQHESIKEVVVLAREIEVNEKYICAYVVSDKNIKDLNLRSYLRGCLPAYMIPSYFVQMGKMPLTPNGKLDRKALPEPNLEEMTNEYEAPRNEVEEILAKIWCEVLKIDKVGINDNFFEIGGHSLKATVLKSKIHKAFNKDILLKELFRLPTIKELSAFLEEAEENIYKKIEIVEEKECYEASSAQKRMYMLQGLEIDSIAYNILGGLDISGDLDVDRLNETFKKLIKRHEALRTSFYAKEDMIVQKVHAAEEIKFETEKVAVHSEEEIKAKAKEFIKPFDLGKAPLLRVSVLSLEKDRHIMLFDMHHIISDGVSMSILAKEFSELYAGEDLEELKVQYKDYSAWQLKKRESEEYREQEKYWLNEFSGELPVLNLPTDYARQSLKNFRGSSVYFTLDKDITKKLRSVAKETESTLHMVLLASLNILLAKYSGQEDFIVGTPITGRNHGDLENIIGMFVNTLAIRTNVDSQLSFKEYLKTVREKTLSASENQDYQFEELVDQVAVNRDLNRNPLFDVMFVLQNMDEAKLEIEDLIFKLYKFSVDVEKFDITMTAVERDHEINIDLSYSTSLYKHETIERMVNHFLNIVKEITRNIEVELKDIDLLSDDEKHKLLVEFNNTVADYPKDKTIHELFEEQVKRTPNNIAVVIGDKEFTYKELNERSNSLARVLREKGVGPEVIVGIMMNRSTEMIVGIMAILKAGGVYLPMDPDYPKDRIEYMLKDSQTQILLSTNGLANRIETSVEIIDLLNTDLFEGDSSDLNLVNTPQNLAYIIYTSGTTGNPKGVMIEHKNVVRLLFNHKMKFDFNEKDVWTMFHSYCFDFSVWEMYGALLYGGKLVLIPKDSAMDGVEFLRILKEEKVTVLNQIPTPFYSLMNTELTYSEKELNLRYVIFGGEALKTEMLREWIKKYPDTKLINMYGITETTVHVTYKEIEEKEINEGICNIGKPIPTLTTYIMDENSRILPVGVPGELCVGGDGVARGYLNKKELTQQKFVTNPYNLQERIYRSGDKARLLHNGEIEYLGRIDFQVKIRGFRIELGEIENCLLKVEGITEVIVIDKGENENKDLYAYYVGKEEFSAGELREKLKKSLPDYMVPKYYIKMEKMPLTSNGKIDRKSLPDPEDVIHTGAEYEAPSNELETKLVNIWQDILGVSNIGINDNFFELGGHSLKATVLISKIHKELNKTVPLKEIFKSPTIKELSAFVENEKDSIFLEIEKIRDEGKYETSSAQKRMYMLQQFDKDSTAYNMPTVFELGGNINEIQIEETFRKLVKRHEALRTYFETNEDQIIQRIDNSYEFELEIVQEREDIDTIINNFLRPFDLNKASLLRIELVKSKEKTYLLIDMHHIISDGVSCNILINDFIEIYNGKELEPLKLQYKDFAEWQNKFLNAEDMKKQEEYWLNIFSDEIPVLNIPTDYKRPVIKSFEGDDVGFELDEKLIEQLKEFTKETGTTMHMVLLSAFYILLSKYSRQEDIVIGVPVAGRSHADLQKIMGIFVNTLALRMKPEGGKKFTEFFKEVKENSIKAYENQSYQFEALIEKLNVRRNTSRSPMFDVMFNMVDIETENMKEFDGFLLEKYNYENKTSKFDLTLNVTQSDKTIDFTLEYCTKLFNKETIERLGKHFIRILKNVMDNPKLDLNKIDLLTEEEKVQLLYEFNNKKVDYPKYKTIQQLFEEQVEKTPDNIAVVFEDKKLTYRELNERANILAIELRSKGIKSDSIVGIMVERSLEMIIGIIGILKSGGAYLPIDPGYPIERIEYMLEDSKCQILLSEASLEDKLKFKGHILDLFKIDLLSGESRNPEAINGFKDLAYVIYTSGSTGMPKGVMIEQQQVNNFIHGITKETKLNSYKNILCITTVCFDIFGLETLVPLTNGLEVIIASREASVDSKKLARIIDENKIEVMQSTPSRLNILLENEDFQESISHLKLVLVGGEEVTSSLFNKWNKHNNAKIYNVYGPTETTIWSTIKLLEQDEKITIGRPISNTSIYILNEDKQMPIGVEGELCIGGDGVARGYLNRAELTAEKFVENPFEQGQKIYRTGDLARWLPDGNIEFLGRIDNQVKVRGFRIELGEIANRVLQHDSVKEAVVVVKENKENEKYICAYVVSDKEMKELKLRDSLRESLPEYMIPSYFVQMEKMPLTPNGKLNRRALPDPSIEENINESEAPRSEVEKVLAELWSEVLGIEKIGINDNFFELGGHSLKATVLLSKVQKVLNKEIPLNELFRLPTIKGIGILLETKEENAYSEIEKIKHGNIYKASSAQKRMYMLQQFDKASTAYNMPTAFELDGNINIKRIEETFRKLIERHESLRTSFETNQFEIVQRIHHSYEFKLKIRQESKDLDTIRNKFIKPFDLSKAPLLRVEIVESEEKTYLLIDMHHIISDGVSGGILVNEFIELYKGRELQPLKLQYKDFAEWQNKFLKTEEMKNQEKYWLNMFGDGIPVLNLPTDYERPAIQSFAGDSLSFKVNEKTTERLRHLTKETGTTMHMVLLSAFYILLSKYSEQEDIVIGIPIAGRSHADLQSIMGMFVNTLALRNKPEGNKMYMDFLKEVKENSLYAHENQNYQFEMLIESLNLVRDTSRNPLFDVMFDIAVMESDRDMKVDDLILRPYEMENNISKFDLNLEVVEYSKTFEIVLSYCVELFHKDTIEFLLEDYDSILKTISNDPNVTLNNIELIKLKNNDAELEFDLFEHFSL